MTLWFNLPPEVRRTRSKRRKELQKELFSAELKTDFWQSFWLYFCLIGFFFNLGVWSEEPTFPNFALASLLAAVFSVLIFIYDSFSIAMRGAISQECVEYVEATPELKEKMERQGLKRLEKKSYLLPREKELLKTLQAKYSHRPEIKEETT